jgi:Leucine-rich repeat (LRR) protein
MLHVKYIDDDLYEGATKKAFPTLKKMRLYDLPNLERVLKAEGVEMLSQLSDLSIEGIPKQLAFPSLPYVESFDARGNTERDSIDGGASFLMGIAAIMHNLKKLIIQRFGELKVLPNELNSLSSLQELDIEFCYKLESIPECVLQGLSSLQVLKFRFCCSLKSLPEGTNLTSLQTLYIYDCPKLSSLPASFKELINLNELRIYRCPVLEKRSMKETGEDWHKIAHVPILRLGVRIYI